MSLLEEMKQAVDFSNEDAARLRELKPHITPFLATIVQRFYERLFRDPKARAIFTGGEEQMIRQRKQFEVWLGELFDGVYDETYFQKRFLIGNTHVRVGLAQHSIFTSMQLVWQELRRILLEGKIPNASETLESLHRILMLDLAIMLESYKESYSEKIREIERTAVEERLTRAEHLAEIGRLAASMAHEIKNPLAGISGAIQIIGEAMEPDAPHRPIIGEILREIGRLDAAVKDLLVYARPSPIRAEEVPLGEVVRRTLAVLREEPSVQRVTVECDGLADSPPVWGDDGQIEQLVINLVINAADASEEGGVVRIATSDDDQWVTLTVQDFGQGLSQEVQDRAFEPFYTTKAKGTGLGLSICRKIVEAHGGKITLQGEENVGTTATIMFPRSRRKPGPSETP